jgi:RNase H-fold protein (predicted Holliday junction resolvase)
VRREKRRKIVDQLAAGIILQGYLDSLGPAKTC